MGNMWRHEPIVILGVIEAGLALLLAFGFDLTGEQVGAIMAFAAAVVAVVGRQNVFSPATIEAEASAASATALDTEPTEPGVNP